MEHAKHIIRAVLLLLMIAVLFVLVRHFVYPKSFGAYGHYRFDSVAEYAAQQPLHGAPDGCRECHDEAARTNAGGKHASVSCEVCHGPRGIHVSGDARTAAMPVVRSTPLCGWCHQRLVARGSNFPQVDLTDHVIERGGQPSETACLECHDAHNPGE